jgi:hypothetical protein
VRSRPSLAPFTGSPPAPSSDRRDTQQRGRLPPMRWMDIAVSAMVVPLPVALLAATSLRPSVPPSMRRAQNGVRGPPRVMRPLPAKRAPAQKLCGGIVKSGTLMRQFCRPTKSWETDLVIGKPRCRNFASRSLHKQNEERVKRFGLPMRLQGLRRLATRST